jgi:hypothetical protein
VGMAGQVVKVKREAYPWPYHRRASSQHAGITLTQPVPNSDRTILRRQSRNPRVSEFRHSVQVLSVIGRLSRPI